MDLRRSDFEPILTEVELDVLQQVRDAKEPIEDPTILMILFHAVERLATRIRHMRELDEDAAQAIQDHLALQPSVAEYEHGLSVLNSIADDLIFNITE